MPRFHFDVSFGDGFERDSEGTELCDAITARTEAIALAPELVKASLPHVLHAGGIAIHVRDGLPQPLSIVRISMAVEDRV